jgi:hypothetical protein
MNSPSGGSHLPVFRGAFRVTNGHTLTIANVQCFEKRFKLSIVAQSFAYRRTIIWA